MNKRRLLRLAKHLETVPQRYFDMASYRRKYGDKEMLRIYPSEALALSWRDCGAVGCALGHAPELGGAFTPKSGEVWEDYCERVFGIHAYSSEWDWMFSWNWGEMDNTPRGAAQRIRWLAKNGLPEDSEDQLFWGAPLCYRSET